MATFTYQTHLHLLPNAVRTDLREEHTPGGTYWMVGASGRQTQELLNRFQARLSASAPLNNEQFNRVLEEFLVWYRQTYQQKNGKPCPDADDQIVQGVGLLCLSVSGQATFISRGNFIFSVFADDQLMPVPVGYEQRGVPRGALLMADPTRSPVLMKVIEVYRKGERQWSAVRQEPFGYAVGLVYAESVPEPEPIPEPVLPGEGVHPERGDPPLGGGSTGQRGLVLGLLVALLLAIGWGGYPYIFSYLDPPSSEDEVAFFEADSSLADTTAMEIDSVVPTYPDPAPAIDPDTAVTGDDERDPPAADDSVQDPVSPSTTRPQAETKPKPVQPVPNPMPTPIDNRANEYVEAAERAFADAERYRANGKVEQAVTQYRAALARYERFCVLEPERKATVQPQMATCRQTLQLLTKSPEF